MLKEENLKIMEEATPEIGTAKEVAEMEREIMKDKERDQDPGKDSPEGRRQNPGEGRDLLPESRIILNRYMTFITLLMMIM